MFFNTSLHHRQFRQQRRALFAAVIPMLVVLLLAQKVSASAGTYDGNSCPSVKGALSNQGTSSATLPVANADSLLIVVVNHSTCVQQADPTNYSASVTDMLSDLWPGPMAVVMLQSNGVTTVGPLPTSVRNALKTQVNNTPFSGNVPLEQGMQAAQNIFLQQGSPQGSRVVVLTTASGMTENAQAVSQSVTTFANEKVAVYTYGIAGAGSDQGTVSLLQQIANATGGEYQSISDASSMSQAVTHFCELNCGDSFTHIAFNPAHHDYIIPLQDASQSLNLLTFYDTGTGRNILGYAGRQIVVPQLNQSLQNNHYEFDTISSLQEKCPCNITLDAGDDTNVLVYAFKTGVKQIPPPPPPPSFPLWLIIVLILLLLLFIALILWLLLRKREMGYLIRERTRSENDKLTLGTNRPILKRIFSKSRIAMKELEQHPQVGIITGLVQEPLFFVATRDGVFLHKEPGKSTTVSVRMPSGEEIYFKDTVAAIPLKSGCIILKGGRSVVKFLL